MMMYLTVEGNDESNEFEGCDVPEGNIDLTFVPTIGTVLRFDPHIGANDTVACFVQVWGIDVHMEIPKRGTKIPKTGLIHLFAKPDHRTTRDALIALGQLLNET